MNEYKLFTQRVGLIGITNLLLGLSGIILLPILTKNLPIKEYGLWVQINVTIGLISTIAVLGLPYTMVRFLAVAKKREEIQEGFYSIFYIVMVISAIISLLLFLLSESIATILFDNNIIISRILPLIIFIECLNATLVAFFRTFQQIKKYSFFSVTKTCLEIALLAYFVFSGYGIFGAVIGILTAKFFVFTIMASNIILEIGIKIPKFTNIREYMSFGIPTVPGILSSWVINSSDRYLIGILLSTAFVGYYAPGYALGNIINMFLAPISFVLPAVLSKYYDKNNMKDVKIVLKYSLKYFLILAIPSAFGLSILSKPILMILTTPEIASEGYLITPFVATSALLMGVYTVTAQIIVLKKKTKITGMIWIIAAILNFGLNFVFIPYMGILGAAITTLLAFAFMFVLIMHYSFKYLIFDVDLPSIFKSIFASIVMSLVVIKLNPVGILSILTVIGVCAMVYFAILLLLKAIKKEEIEFFRGVFKI